MSHAKYSHGASFCKSDKAIDQRTIQFIEYKAILDLTRVGLKDALFDLLYLPCHVLYYSWIACGVLLQVFKVQSEAFEYLGVVLHCGVKLEEEKQQILLFCENWIVTSLTRRVQRVFSFRVQLQASPG